MAEILVVDDDLSVVTAFERFLEREGHGCTIASNAEEAVRLVGELAPDLVVMDIRMPGVDGLQALQEMRSRYPDVHIIMMTAHGTSQTSIDAIRAGAFEYLTKPLDLEHLRGVISQALATRANRPHEGDAGEAATATVALVGNTPPMQDVYRLIGRLAINDVPALVVGERGTGKELVVATIHDNSPRRADPFITLDCGTLPEQALEAELVSAERGTLYLANVHALPRTLQARLARTFTEGTRTPGRAAPAARILASTDADIGDLVASGSFSREVYDSLSVITVGLPPLRARSADIPLLVKHFVTRFNEELNRTIRGVDEQVLARFEDHAWPGNVGELESVVKRACIVTRGDFITSADIGDSLSSSRLPARQEVESALYRAVRTALQERLVEKESGTPSSAFHDIVGIVEAALVKEALAITSGNQVKASDLLGVNRATLRKKAQE